MGMKLSAREGDRIVSIDPATLEPLGDVRIATKDEVEAAVRRARAAAPAWVALGFRGRGEILTRVKELILDETDAIADLISRENGKTVTTALAAEIFATVDLIVWHVSNAETLLAAENLPLRQWRLLGRRSYLTYPALGTVGIISPWNFPFSIPMSAVVAALMAGNTVVLKPSEVTPFVGLKIGELFRRAGLPDGVLEVVTGDGSTGAALCDSPVQKIFFTGSTRTGKRIMEACAKRLTPCVLELGGNAPMLVLKDANLDTAVPGAVWGSYVNSGQVCASVQRIYVAPEIADAFTSRLVEETQKVRVGVGRGPGTCDIGSLTSQAQLEIVESLVEDARKNGAKILCGGKRPAGLRGFFYEPTVVSGAGPDFRIMKEEIFGPVVTVSTFRDEEDAVRLANDNEYGLMASVWTRDIERGERLARRIESGTTIVNDHAMTYGIPDVPWGGVKQSGFGRTHGKLGLLEFVDWRHVHVNATPSIRFPWWFPERETTYKAFKEGAAALGRSAVGKRVLAALGLAKDLALAAVNGR
jgi:acyl-CoA reductase-like NAD-dependent aldehyde dehydrogenase